MKSIIELINNTKLSIILLQHCERKSFNVPLNLVLKWILNLHFDSDSDNEWQSEDVSFRKF